MFELRTINQIPEYLTKVSFRFTYKSHYCYPYKLKNTLKILLINSFQLIHLGIEIQLISNFISRSWAPGLKILSKT